MSSFSKWRARSRRAATVATMCALSTFGLSQTSSLGSNGSAEAQLRIYRALSAAADDVASQLEAKLGASSSPPTFVLYDPRILSDLLVLNGFRQNLTFLQDEYAKLRKRPVPSFSTTGPIGPTKLFQIGKLLADLEQKLVTAHEVYPEQRRDKALGVGQHITSQFVQKAVSTMAAALPPLSAPVTLTPQTVSTTTASTGAGGQGNGQGGGGGQNSGGGNSSGSGNANSSQGAGASSTPTVFFPNTLSGLEGDITALNTLATTFMGRTTAANGVPGPTNAESFVMGKIAKRLPGAFYYPSITPIQSDDARNPLLALFSAQRSYHEIITDLSARLDVAAQSISRTLNEDSLWQPPTAILNLEADVAAITPRDGGYVYTPEQLTMLASDAGAATRWVTGDPQVKSDTQGGALTGALKALTDAITAAQKGPQGDAKLTSDLVSKNDAVFKWALSAISGLRGTYTRTANMTQIADDVASGVTPAQLTQQVQAARAELQANISVSDAQKAPTYALLNDVETQLPPLLDLYQQYVADGGMLDQTAVSLNGSPSGSSTQQSTTNAVGGQGNQTQQGSQTAQQSQGAQSSQSSADTLSTILLRASQYESLLNQGAHILRVTVEMSWATDRLDTYGLNRPSRKSSAAAELSFTMFNKSGGIDQTGSSLAYLSMEGDRQSLTGGTAQIARDEPEGQVVFEKPSVTLRVAPWSSPSAPLSVDVLAQLGVPFEKKAELAGDHVFAWLYDEDGHPVPLAGGSPQPLVTKFGGWTHQDLQLAQGASVVAGHTYKLTVKIVQDAAEGDVRLGQEDMLKVEEQIKKLSEKRAPLDAAASSMGLTDKQTEELQRLDAELQRLRDRKRAYEKDGVIGKVVASGTADVRLAG